MFLCLGVPTLKMTERVLIVKFKVFFFFLWHVVIVLCACMCIFYMLAEVSSVLVVIQFIFKPLEVRIY